MKRESLIAECEASLRRLRVETIDLYQIHWPDPDQDLEVGWQTLSELVQQGKIRYPGVSNCSVEQLRRLLPIHPPASLQPPYSLLDRRIEQEAMAFCRENGIGIVAYSPMAKGLLTGTFNQQRAAALPPDDHRSRDPKFQQPLLGINLRFVETLMPIAAHHGHSVPQLAIAWVLQHAEVTAAIVGRAIHSKSNRPHPPPSGNFLVKNGNRSSKRWPNATATCKRWARSTPGVSRTRFSERTFGMARLRLRLQRWRRSLRPLTSPKPPTHSSPSPTRESERVWERVQRGMLAFQPVS